ncbi:MAG TPA: thioredoxin [Pseudonocardiaceae bacterium]|jgi:thioredoxin 1|nr:thioredoxin [Pseudonocardiaceae bacterium]
MSPTKLAGPVPAVTDDTFAQEVLGQDTPVLVEFWAQWCGPCHMVAPVLAEIAGERADRLLVRKINADENPATARDYQVMSLPTLMLFQHGRPIRSLVGARPKSRLLAELDDALEPRG